jgi:hypothetical protein
MGIASTGLFIDIGKDCSPNNSFMEHRYEFLNFKTCPLRFVLSCGVGGSAVSAQSGHRKNGLGFGDETMQIWLCLLGELISQNLLKHRLGSVSFGS